MRSVSYFFNMLLFAVLISYLAVAWFGLVSAWASITLGCLIGFSFYTLQEYHIWDENRIDKNDFILIDEE